MTIRLNFHISGRCVSEIREKKFGHYKGMPPCVVMKKQIHGYIFLHPRHAVDEGYESLIIKPGIDTLFLRL